MRWQLQPVVPPGVRGHLPRNGREGGLHLCQLRREGLPVPQVKVPTEPSGLEQGELRSFPLGLQGLFGEPGCNWCYFYPHGIIFQNSKRFLTLFVFSLLIFVVVEVCKAGCRSGGVSADSKALLGPWGRGAVGPCSCPCTASPYLWDLQRFESCVEHGAPQRGLFQAVLVGGDPCLLCYQLFGDF